MNKRLKLLNAVLASSLLIVPHMAKAVFNIGGVVTDTTVTTDEDDVTNTISSTGTVVENVATEAILVNNTGNTIDIAASEMAFAAVTANAAAVDGIKINANKTNTTINIGANRTIDATAAGGNAIETGADATTITNNGMLTASNAASGATINALAAGTNLTITNNTGGTIHSKAGPAITTAAGASGLTFNNFGTATAEGAASTLFLNDNFMSIASSGSITNTGTGSAVNLAGIGVATSFSNTGLIENNKLGAATVLATGASKITNDFINGAAGTITNKAAGAVAVDFGTGGAGVDIKFFNAGAVNGNVLLAGAGGDVFSMTGGTITGDVTAGGAAAQTLSLSGGTITGDLIIGGVAGNTFNMTGGSILEDLALNKATTANISAGTIGDPGVPLTGIDLGVAGNTINISGSTDIVNGIAETGAFGGQTINFSGGSYGKLGIIGLGAGNVFNTDGEVKSSGPIDMFQTVHVKSPVFTVNHPITNVNDKLQNDGVLNVNADITGTGGGVDGFVNTGKTVISTGNKIDVGTGDIVNTGTVQVAAGAAPGLLGAKITNTGGILAADIKTNPILGCPSPGNGACSPITVTGTATLAGSGVQLNAVGDFIPSGSTWDIVKAPGGIDVVPTLFSNSSSLKYTGAIVGPNLQVTALAIPFSSQVANSEITGGLASSLDLQVSKITLGNLAAQNPTLLTILGQLQTINTPEGLEQALRSLVPNYNHSISTMSTMAVRRAFDDIGMRLEELQALRPLFEEADVFRDDEDLDGWSYGDEPLKRHQSGAWVRPYAGIVDQQKRDTVEGYRGDYVGITVGGDWRILDWAAIGVAGSFAKSDVTQRGFIGAEQDINSYQLTFYGQFDPYGPLYVNALLGLARHKYKTQRDVSVGSFVTKTNASFSGFHYGGRVEAGYAYFNGKYYINPILALDYLRLDQSSYSETGSPVALTVRNDDVSELAGTLGLRLAVQNEYQEATYIPEIAGYLRHDFVNDRQQTFNNFGFGGPTFTSKGIEPDETSYILNLGFRMHTYNDLMFKIGYEFEAKSQFKAHSVFFKWYHKWH